MDSSKLIVEEEIELLPGYHYLQFIENRLSLRYIIDKLSHEDDPANTSSIH